MLKRIILICLVLLGNTRADIFINNDENAYKCSDLNDILQEKLDLTKDILFFVHGRGKHPEKGLAYIDTVEGNYDLNVIMFHWNSWINSISRPENNAIDSSRELQNCLNQINRYKEVSKTDKKFFFFSHSMGNIVFKYFLKDLYEKSTFNNELFKSIILNAPDVESKKHNLWVDKIDFSKNIFITFNLDDSVLIGSKAIDYKDVRPFRGFRLGTRPYSGITKKANYLDFSKLTIGGHEYFRYDKSHNITKILNSIFKNNSFSKFPHNQHKKYKNVFIFK